MYLLAAIKISHIDGLSVFGLFAVGLMLTFYALERRSPIFVLAFAGACLLAATYGFLQGAWPFGGVETIWSMIALRRWRSELELRASSQDSNSGSGNVVRFLADLAQVAPAASGGHYSFSKIGGGVHGFVQFIIASDRKLEIHRLWACEPGKGSGSIMLRILCELADRHDVELALKVLPIGRKPYPQSRENLKAWYQRHGFEGPRWKVVRKPPSATSPNSRIHKTVVPLDSLVNNAKIV